MTGTTWHSVKDWVKVTDCYRMCKRLYGEEEEEDSYGKYLFECPEP